MFTESPEPGPISWAWTAVCCFSAAFTVVSIVNVVWNLVGHGPDALEAAGRVLLGLVATFGAANQTSWGRPWTQRLLKTR